MALIRRRFNRTSGFRDSRIYVIATEGMRKEPKYFKDLDNFPEFRNPRVHVHIIERQTSASSPRHILNELIKIKTDYSLNRYDELWMIIDRDAWKERDLSEVATLCSQKGFCLAISNPCFELWLLLHGKDIAGCSEEEIKLHMRKDYLVQELKRIYHDNPDSEKLFPTIQQAIERARKLDIRPDDRWPQTLGTRVYLLVSKILPTA